MTSAPNPALAAFISELRQEIIFAQVIVRRVEGLFELRHVTDGGVEEAQLEDLRPDQARALARFTSSGQFRPLKSAPNLRTGWRILIRNPEELERALDELYPGAVADWFRVREGSARPTHYRDFTTRQTGMYRITAMLPDREAIPAVLACCHPNFCLKQRLWTVADLAADPREAKSMIPCLEPCALLLEFARKAMRLVQQEERGELPAAPVAEESIELNSIREADFENPNNPRRLQLDLERKKMQS